MFTEQEPNVIDQETLAGIVAFAWEMFTHESPIACSADAPADGMSATISIGGPWTATLEVIVTQELARTFAATLLGGSPADLPGEDVDDALGELANVVGGNIKGLLDDGGNATLSLPVVSRVRPSVTGGQLTVSCAFDCGGQTMYWGLFERP